MEGAYARCVENEPLALFILEQRQALAAKDGYKEKLDATLSKAYRNVCDCDHPICSLKDASQIQGIGQWVLKLLKGFFPEPAIYSSQEALDKGTPNKKSNRRYVPQKSSAPYAILLTLYKAMQEGREHMKKQELIDAADASGLSRMAIQPNKCAGPSAQFGYSTKDWYSGWSSMKTLITKGLVFKSSCPAKYKLTEEGIFTAQECLQRSGVQTKAAIASGSEISKTLSSDSMPAMVDERSKASYVKDDADLSAEEDMVNRPGKKYKLTKDKMSTSEECTQSSTHQTCKHLDKSSKKPSIPFPSVLVAERSKALCAEEYTNLSSDSDEADDAVKTVVVEPSRLAKSCNIGHSADTAVDKLRNQSCQETQFSKELPMLMVGIRDQHLGGCICHQYWTKKDFLMRIQLF